MPRHPTVLRSHAEMQGDKGCAWPAPHLCPCGGQLHATHRLIKLMSLNKHPIRIQSTTLVTARRRASWSSLLWVASSGNLALLGTAPCHHIQQKTQSKSRTWLAPKLTGHSGQIWELFCFSVMPQWSPRSSTIINAFACPPLKSAMWHWGTSSKTLNSTSSSSLKSFNIIISNVPYLFFPNNPVTRSGPKAVLSHTQRYQIWSLKLFSPVIPRQPWICPRLACVLWKTVLTFLLVFPESEWPQADFSGSDEGIYLSCHTSYSRSQTKTQQFWHSTQHQVCLWAVPGRTGLHNGGRPFTGSYNHQLLAGRDLCRSPSPIQILGAELPTQVSRGTA